MGRVRARLRHGRGFFQPLHPPPAWTVARRLDADSSRGGVLPPDNNLRANLWKTRTGGDPPSLVNCYDEDEQTDAAIDRIVEHRENGIELKQQACCSGPPITASDWSWHADVHQARTCYAPPLQQKFDRRSRGCAIWSNWRSSRSG